MSGEDITYHYYHVSKLRGHEEKQSKEGVHANTIYNWYVHKDNRTFTFAMDRTFTTFVESRDTTIEVLKSGSFTSKITTNIHVSSVRKYSFHYVRCRQKYKYKPSKVPCN